MDAKSKTEFLNSLNPKKGTSRLKKQKKQASPMSECSGCWISSAAITNAGSRYLTSQEAHSSADPNAYAVSEEL